MKRFESARTSRADSRVSSDVDISDGCTRARRARVDAMIYAGPQICRVNCAHTTVYLSSNIHCLVFTRGEHYMRCAQEPQSLKRQTKGEDKAAALGLASDTRML